MSSYYYTEYITLPNKKPFVINRDYFEVETNFAKAFNIDSLIRDALTCLDFKDDYPELISDKTKIRFVIHNYNEERPKYKFIGRICRYLAFKRFIKEDDLK